MATWSGYYINLDRSAGRRANMEARLGSAGLAGRYQRFAAVDGASLAPTKLLSAPVHACFRSHHDLIAAHGGSEFIHIVEDDAIFSPEMERVISAALSSNALADVDLVFLNLTVAAEVGTLRKMKLGFEESQRTKQCRLIDLRGFPFAGSMSYLVNPSAVPRILRALQDEMRHGPNLPIDLFFRREIHAGRLQRRCFLPFLTTTDHTPSTISAASNPGIELLVELSRSFYIEANHAEGLTRVQSIGSREPEDRHLDLLGAIERLLISPRLGES
jgi:GR25 family glycosyltransferase involved in LPS biosynthesis